MNFNRFTRIKNFNISDHLLLLCSNFNVTHTIYVPQLAGNCECS